jgi:hypothetical protein
MTVQRRGKNTFLVRVYLGRDPQTKKRIEINETVHGNYFDATGRETELKAEKNSARLTKSSSMTLNQLLKLYFDTNRHSMSVTTQYKYRSYCEFYVEQSLGTKPINKITSVDIQQLFNQLLDKKETNDDSNK